MVWVFLLFAQLIKLNHYQRHRPNKRPQLYLWLLAHKTAHNSVNRYRKRDMVQKEGVKTEGDKKKETCESCQR